jgi:hypothetical protein
MGKSKGMIKRRGTSEPMEEKVQSMPRLAKKSSSEPLGYANLALQKRKVSVPKMTPKRAETIKTGGASERVQSNTPKKSMAQIGKEMSKSGPRKNLRETAAVVKGKLQNAYNKATGRKTVSMEMDGKTFTGTDKMGVRRGVTKVSNPTAGSRKIVDVYTSEGNLKRQKIVDKFPGGKRRVTKSGPDADAIYQKEQSKLMRKRKG